jgi:hypothetical protein
LFLNSIYYISFWLVPLLLHCHDSQVRSFDGVAVFFHIPFLALELID